MTNEKFTALDADWKVARIDFNRNFGVKKYIKYMMLNHFVKVLVELA